MNFISLKKSYYFPNAYRKGSFGHDIFTFFTRQKESHIGKWLYSDQNSDDDQTRGANLWEEWATERHDYMSCGQTMIIARHAKDIAKLTGSTDSIIDLGPGDKDAVARTAIPFIKAYADCLLKYTAVDICSTYASQAQNIVKEAFPALQVNKYIGDLRTEKFYKTIQNGAVFLFLGSTIGNFYAPQRTDKTIPLLAKELENLKINFNIGDHLIVGLDTNQDVNSLYQAYGDAKHAKYAVNFMHRVRRDLIPHELGFSPDAWVYRMDWHPKSYQFCHLVEATEDQNFKLNGQLINVKKGETFSTENSFKIPVGVFQQAAIQAGYEPLASYLDDDKRMALHVLRVVA